MPDMIYRLCWFGNENATGSIQGALPVGQNSLRQLAFGLCAEQLSEIPWTIGRRGASGCAAYDHVQCIRRIELRSVYGVLAGTRQCGGFSGRIRDCVVKFRDGMQSKRHDPPVSREP